MSSVGWTLGICIYAPGARRRENWDEWLWLGVWPAPESPSWGRRQGRVGAMAGWGPRQRRGLLWVQHKCLSSSVGLGTFKGHYLGC